MEEVTDNKRLLKRMPASVRKDTSRLSPVANPMRSKDGIQIEVFRLAWICVPISFNKADSVLHTGVLGGAIFRERSRAQDDVFLRSSSPVNFTLS